MAKRKTPEDNLTPQSTPESVLAEFINTYSGDFGCFKKGQKYEVDGAFFKLLEKNGDAKRCI